LAFSVQHSQLCLKSCSLLSDRLPRSFFLKEWRSGDVRNQLLNLSLFLPDTS
jgi:hypothetical protein